MKPRMRAHRQGKPKQVSGHRALPKRMLPKLPGKEG
jgi:hypothetical protein